MNPRSPPQCLMIRVAAVGAMDEELRGPAAYCEMSEHVWSPSGGGWKKREMVKADEPNKNVNVNEVRDATINYPTFIKCAEWLRPH
ncbi:hypothetical protein A0H81_07639 [Grifola frondosa]|uniref:Uncharacterized protein n=1 Tax=Grifola frondosa TaxID=5627 RepID=A0A1C7M5E1_GRIFR|nr:hypothetical protein A0H81_07639 [Grifola frondosa]